MVTRIVVLLSVMFYFTSCSSVFEEEEFTGNIYSLKGNCSNWTDVYINGLRINQIKGDTLDVTIKYGKELFGNFDFVGQDNLYRNIEPFIFFDKLKGQLSAKVELYIPIRDVINIRITENSKIQNLEFEKKYQSKIDLKFIHNVYNAEIGFDLCDKE